MAILAIPGLPELTRARFLLNPPLLRHLLGPAYSGPRYIIPFVRPGPRAGRSPERAFSAVHKRESGPGSRILGSGKRAGWCTRVVYLGRVQSRAVHQARFLLFCTKRTKVTKWPDSCYLRKSDEMTRFLAVWHGSRRVHHVRHGSRRVHRAG